MQVLTDLKRRFFLTSPGGSPQTKHRYPPNPYNRANRVNRVNPAPLWLQALGHASNRGGQAPALRARGGVLFAMRRSGAGAPELRSPQGL